MTFSAHLSAIGEAGLNIQRNQTWILIEDLFERHAGGEKVENQRDPNARALDSWLAEADVRVDRDAIQQFVVCIHG